MPLNKGQEQKAIEQAKIIAANAQSGAETLKGLGELLNATFRHAPNITVGQGLAIEDMASVAHQFAKRAFELSGALRSEITLALNHTNVSLKSVQVPKPDKEDESK